jgi:hypothetical protein
MSQNAWKSFAIVIIRVEGSGRGAASADASGLAGVVEFD